ncbi:MAG: hypothetical protein U1E15_10285 [Hyphomicrobiales bacterium]
MAAPVQPFSPEDMARRRRRNWALALALLVMVALFFVSTIVRLGGHTPGAGT